MTKRAELDRHAQQDIVDIEAFYESKLEGLGARFLDELTAVRIRIEE